MATYTRMRDQVEYINGKKTLADPCTSQVGMAASREITAMSRQTLPRSAPVESLKYHPIKLHTAVKVGLIPAFLDALIRPLPGPSIGKGDDLATVQLLF